MARNRRRAQRGAEEAIAAGPPMLDAGRFSQENRRRLSGPGLRTFLDIAGLWGLSEAERLMVLGLPGRSTYFGWIARARDGRDLVLPVDALLRISGVLGVHKALRILFGDSTEDALAWLRGPHDAPQFGGQPPMALLVNGTQDGIMLVRRYLDAFRGGVFAAPGTFDHDAAPLSDDDIVIA
ncbi:MAG: MbcA/ParS/Xre antitoxin family protein [Kiloniellales bacterium]